MSSQYAAIVASCTNGDARNVRDLGANRTEVIVAADSEAAQVWPYC